MKHIQSVRIFYSISVYNKHNKLLDYEICNFFALCKTMENLEKI